MNNRKIAVAGLVFLALLAALILDHRVATERDRRRTLSERLLPFPIEEARSVRIERLGETVSLERGDEGWRLKEPVDTPADAEAMTNLLYFLEHQQRIGPQAASPDQLDAFGLLKPGLRVAVAGGGEQEARFEIGVDAPVQGEAYARLADDPEYFTVAADLKSALSRSIDELRDRSLVAFNANEATTITLIVQGDPPIQAVREDKEWRLLSPIRGSADSEAVNAIVQALHLTRAQDFIDTDTLHLERFGLDVPFVVAHLERAGSAQPLQSTLTLGKIRDAGGRSYYAKRQDRSSVFAVPQGLAFALAPDLDDLRSKTLFSIAGADVQEMELEFAGDVVRLKRDPRGLWRFNEAGGDAADQTVANEALRYLLTMRVRKFLEVQPGLADAGLDDPRLRVTVRNADGKTESIETGRSGQGPKNRDIVYARRPAGGEIFGVPIEVPGKLFLNREKFMDKTIYNFDAASVGSVKYTAGERVVLFRREENSWIATMLSTGEEAQVSRNVIDSLLLNMLALRWSSRLDPKVDSDMTAIKSAGLDDPPLVFEIFDDRQQLLTTICLGPQQDRRFVYIRRDQGGRAEFFAIDRPGFIPFLAALKEMLQP